MFYTFDDVCIGLTSDNIIVESSRIDRPKGLDNSSWYSLASEICREINNINQKLEEGWQ